MLMLLLPTTALIPSALVLPPKQLHILTTTYSMTITLMMLKWFYQPLNPKPQILNTWSTLDHISTPLIILSAWILPLMLIASQHHLHQETFTRKRLFICTCATLQAALILTFSAANLVLFYIMFETTLIPTLVLITRWGGQAERLLAGTYFLFYTLMGSLPLLIAILSLYATYEHTTLLSLTLLNPKTTNPLMWLAFLMALMVKMPLYGLHLWLPKAHVEAPIAGSMILAAVLLKLGGYGLIRLIPILSPTTQAMSTPFIILALWGMIMTSLICLRQPDLKSVIAYSSVSHMGLVITATLIQTPWSTMGAMILMIAHGLTSSMLFCLANTNYERTHTRTLTLTRGLHLLLPTMTLWWLLASLTNMALPPSINLLGELMVITATFNWTPSTLALTGLTTLLTALYSLYIYLTTQHGKPSSNASLPPTHTREHLLMTLHGFPLLLLIACPKLLF